MAVRKFETRLTRQVKAYLVQGNNQPILFFCSPRNLKNIVNEIGQPMADGLSQLLTVADLPFRIGDEVIIDGDSMVIETIQQEIWTGTFGNIQDKNALRGKVRYLTTLTVN